MSSTLAPGTFVGLRYRIASLLGAGGMGQVYRAEHLELRREIALKVLPADAAVPDLVARFELEARAAARLDHPGCVRVLDFGRTVDRHLYIAMELLRGPTLAAVLARQALSVAHAVRIVTDLLDALAHAHRQGVLHRDVKPENVMFTYRDGTPRAVLIDFGLARVRDASPLTAAGICVGSPSYLAPERLLGRAYDGRADIYSVGVILYEALAGVRPFVGRDPTEIARAHISCSPPPLRGLRPDVSPALEAVVRHALSRRPASRFARPEEMLAALAQVPAAEERAIVATRLEEDSTTTLATLAPAQPSAPRRLWGWLRYGGWRWSNAGQSAAGR